MFRDVPSENIRRRLVCKVCKFVSEDIPAHHGKPMVWSLSGSFRKIEYLKCQVCGHTIEMPQHCNTAMFYSEAAYGDLPDLTKSERPDEEE